MRQNQTMAFAPNPLSLSVPDSTFESWLRDSGYLEVLDNASTTATAISASAGPAVGASAIPAAFTPAATTVTQGFLHYLQIFLSLFTINPFAKLTTADISGKNPSWTREFFGFYDSYSVPSSPHTLKLRVHENVKRYARNYVSLFILFFACSLYQLPLALVGLLSSLALWDLFRFCSDRWKLDHHPVTRQVLIRIAQCATVVIMMVLNVQMALFCALGVGYAVMILHAAFRKLTPTKQPSGSRGNKRLW